MYRLVSMLAVQSGAFQQSCKLDEPPCATAQAAAHQARGATCDVERFTFLGCFGLVEATHAEIDDAVLAEHAPADRGNADVEAEGQTFKGLVSHDSLPHNRLCCGYPG